MSQVMIINIEVGGATSSRSNHRIGLKFVSDDQSGRKFCTLLEKLAKVAKGSHVVISGVRLVVDDFHREVVS